MAARCGSSPISTAQRPNCISKTPPRAASSCGNRPSQTASHCRICSRAASSDTHSFKQCPTQRARRPCITLSRLRSRRLAASPSCLRPCLLNIRLSRSEFLIGSPTTLRWILLRVLLLLRHKWARTARSKAIWWWRCIALAQYGGATRHAHARHSVIHRRTLLWRRRLLLRCT